ncbi:MAG: response regulator transcription factor [Methyloversatilis sp.]|nr:response regulator transcription factor [Methyloversatilis sp.]MBP6195515.1 response regulator transcription factor [Methyloversatilis sp.]MBP9118650.1 response regulator transcription factor [Methyloversatilis sp.]
MKLLLVEDHPIFRFGVRQIILQRWPTAEIVEVESLAAALREIRRDGLDIAIVDLNLPDADGLESVSQLRRAAPRLRMLVLSLNAEAAYATRALQMGVSAYLTKDRAADELTQAIERVLAGGRHITASLADRLADLLTGNDGPVSGHQELSIQEYRVLLLLAEGKRLTDIGEIMHLSPKTVTTYRARIMEKLGVTSNADLIRYCINHHLTRDAS